MKNTIKAKEEEKPKESSEQIKALTENGIVVSKAVFSPTILSYGSDKGGTPETALFHESPKASKKANMWLCPGGILVIEQKGQYKANKTWTDLDLL